MNKGIFRVVKRGFCYQKQKYINGACYSDFKGRWVDYHSTPNRKDECKSC